MPMPRTPKSPPEKKRLSLSKDRRNSYGENDKSSRKNIPLSKALSHRKVRRKAKSLEQDWQRIEETKAESRELTLVTPRLQKGRYEKSPDMPLGKLLQGRRTKANPGKR
jgi:hypothetical protein